MRSSARQPSTNRRPPGPAPRPLHYREFTGVCPPPWMVRRRGRIRTCNIRFQRPSCCHLHHPPICRFARPPTRWTPSAGPDVTGTARHCDHPQTLAVPRQGGCRGDPPHGSGARRVPHARRVAYLAYPPGIRTWISTHRGRRAAITPTGHSHPNQTGCKAGMPDSISPAAPRYGVRKLRFKRTVRWVTNPAVKPGRALPSIP